MRVPKAGTFLHVVSDVWRSQAAGRRPSHARDDTSVPKNLVQ